MIAKFPSSNIPNDKKCFPDKPSTRIPIPMVTERYEKDGVLFLPFHYEYALLLASINHKR